QTGVAAPAKITFNASGTSIDVGYTGKPITVLIALKGLSTSTTKGKPFWIATNGGTGIGCALNDYTATTAKTKGCWGNVLWNGAGSPKDMNGLAGTGTKCLAMVTGNAMIQPSDNKKKHNSAIALVTSETVSWQEMDGLRGTGLTADAIYFGNFRGQSTLGMDYTLVGVAVFNGKAADAELKAMATSLTWQGTTSGTANSGTWNTTIDNMWARTFTKEVVTFANNTSVTFKDIATVSTSTVTVDGTVTPAFTVVSNSATTYTFIGSGTIAGSLITKQGDGAVEIACANSASELRVGGGTVKLNHASALNAAGTLTMAGGTLDLNGTSRTIKTLTGTGMITSTPAATLTVTDATTYGGNIGGAVSLAIAANSSLSGAITTTGTITVASGKLKRSGSQPMTINALPAGGIEFDGTSWVDLYTEAPNTEHTLITVTTAPANWDNVTAINVPPFIDFIKSGTTCKIRIVANKNPELTLMPIGDSITEGNTQTMCYRRDLWEQLTAAGYNIRTVGIRRTTFHDHTQTDEKLKWAWHNAFSGARILPSATREGQRMNIDTELEVCGYPDVITVLIGTNNLSDSSDAFFTMWVDYIDRIATLRPNSQILVSTILRTQGNDAKVESHNAKLRTAWGAGTTKSAPFASHPNVTLVDLHTDVTLDNADFYDNLHPNEKGCAKIAAGWSTAIQLVLNKESGLNGNR
ncbi:MAG: GDSL-type esterase/lipase family protein, partial [Kiritimatiellia bacterium]